MKKKAIHPRISMCVLLAAFPVVPLSAARAEPPGEAGANITPTWPGRVTDTEGNPVPGAVLVAGADRFFPKQPMAVADEEGRFSVPALQEPPFVLTALKAGWAPTLAVIEDPDEEIVIVLEPGNTVTFKVTDPEGNPIPYAEIIPHSWRTFTDGKGALTYYRTLVEVGRLAYGPGEPAFQNHTDTEGVFRWAWAPPDTVWYSASHEDFQAEYRIAVSPDTAGAIVVLRPADLLAIQVLGPDGRPLGGASIVLAEGERPTVEITPEGYIGPAAASYSVVRSEAGGRAVFPNPEGPFLLAGLSPYGFGLLSREEAQRGDPLRIKPWAAVEVDITREGNPAGEVKVMVRRDEDGAPGLYQDPGQMLYTDANGIARFDRIPPGPVSVWIESAAATEGAETELVRERSLDLLPGRREYIRIGTEE